MRASRAWWAILALVLFAGAGRAPGAKIFDPKIGICASVGNAATAKSAGCD